MKEKITSDTLVFDNEFTVPCNWFKKAFFHSKFRSLIKVIDDDGSIIYKDLNRTLSIIDNENPDDMWQHGFISSIIDKMYPIKLPYHPCSDARYIVHADYFRLDPKNIDYDTIVIKYMIDQTNGEKIEIYRIFTDVIDPDDASFQEIYQTTFDKLYNGRKLKKGEKIGSRI